MEPTTQLLLVLAAFVWSICLMKWYESIHDPSAEWSTHGSIKEKNPLVVPFVVLAFGLVMAAVIVQAEA